MALTKVTEKSISDNLSISGISSASNFKTGTTNVHNVGVEAAGINVLGADTPIGTGATIFNDGSVRFGHTGNNNTGIVTANKFIGDGSGLTAINASNIGSGTVPTARLGSGTANNTTFLRGDSTFAVVNTDLVADTSPQLGGNLDANSKNIVFGDSSATTSNRLTFGDGDLHIYHNGSDSVIREQGTGNLDIQTTGGNVDILVNTTEHAAKFISNGAVELYHNSVKRFETDTNGVRVVAPEGEQAILRLIGDEGDDNNDYFRLNAGAGTLKLQDASNGSSWEDNIVINAAGSVELYHDNSKRFETSADGILLYPDASGVLISSGGDTNWTTGAMNVVRMGSNQADIRLGSNYGVRIGVSGNNDANEFQFQQDNSNNAFIRNEAANPIKFQTGGSNTRMEILNGGDVKINDGNLVIASGPHGIDFSADSSGTLKTLPNSFNAEILHDYENGTFVPNIQYDTGTNQYTGSPGSGQSVSSSKGEYIRIGDMVWAAGQITLVSNRNSSQSVHISIGGMPYNGMHSSEQSSLMTGWGGAAWPKNDNNTSYRLIYSYHNYTTLNFRFTQTVNTGGISGFNFHVYYRCAP